MKSLNLFNLKSEVIESGTLSHDGVTYQFVV